MSRRRLKVTAMATSNAAKVTMNRINLVFAKYEAALTGVLRDDSVPAARREEVIEESVLVEANFSRCRKLYEMDAGAFVESFGNVHGMNDEDILYNVLLRGSV